MTEERQPTRFTVYVCPECGDVEVETHSCLHPDESGHLQRVEREQIEVVPAAQLDKALAALRELVRLKDGPRDEEYHQRKPEAWDRAREVVKALDGLREPR